MAAADPMCKSRWTRWRAASGSTCSAERALDGGAELGGRVHSSAVVARLALGRVAAGRRHAHGGQVVGQLARVERIILLPAGEVVVEQHGRQLARDALAHLVALLAQQAGLLGRRRRRAPQARLAEGVVRALVQQRRELVGEAGAGPEVLAARRLLKEARRHVAQRGGEQLARRQLGRLGGQPEQALAHTRPLEQLPPLEVQARAEATRGRRLRQRRRQEGRRHRREHRLLHRH
mmetsp:Transcript_14929/g.39960  ORF Transcript_14929/g.39960 Transcript_14929/m.39960 type:complete len:234 (-) Transcript_14929:364-1065(-)